MTVAPWVWHAIGSSSLGDHRRRQRWATIVSQLAAEPAASVAMACGGDWAAIHGLYRFWENEHLAVEDLVASVGQATAQRVAHHQQLVVVHDTTAIRVHADQRCPAVGPLNNPEIRGLWLHSSLAVSLAGLPLGVLDQQVWSRPREGPSRKVERFVTPLEGKESAKWVVGMQAVRTRLHPATRVIHVADREADVYECYQVLAALGDDFVIRVAQAQRRVLEASQHLAQAALEAPRLGTLSVTVQRADDRPARTTTVQLQAAPVTLQPPGYQSYAAARRRWWAAHPAVRPLVPQPLQPVRVWLVEVTEPDPPADVAPLHWRLVTSLPVATLPDAERVVGLYRLRWLVERFHYVLKSGCRIERLQLERVERWARAIVTYSVVAWHVLWLTYLGRVEPEAPGTLVLSAQAWRMLVAVGVARGDPAHVPRVAEVSAAVARLGGYLGRKHDGPPGAKVLWQGWTKLEAMRLGWEAAHHDRNRSVER